MENITAGIEIKKEVEESPQFDVSGYLLDAQFDLEEVEENSSSFVIEPKVEFEEDPLSSNNETGETSPERIFIDEYILADNISSEEEEEDLKSDIKELLDIYQQEKCNRLPQCGKKRNSETRFLQTQQPATANVDVSQEICSEVNAKRIRKPTKPKFLYYDIKKNRKKSPKSKKEEKETKISKSDSTISPNTVNDQPLVPQKVVCGVCGAVRYYRHLKQARKFGVYSCESCRKFISRTILQNSTEIINCKIGNESEELLDEKLQERRVRVVPEKFLNSPHTSRIDGYLNNLKSIKRELTKAMKLSSDKRKVENLKKLESIYKRNSSVDENAKRKKFKSLFENDNGNDTLSSEDDSEDDVVPKKFLNKSEATLTDIQFKYKNLQKKYSVVKEERDDYKQRLSSLEKRFSELVEVNIKFQNQVVNYFENYKPSLESQGSKSKSPSKKSVTPPQVHSSNKMVNSPAVTHSLDKNITKQITVSVGATDSTSDVLALPLEEDLNQGSLAHEKSYPLITQQPDDKTKSNDHFSLSKDKIVAAKMFIKKGSAGDSKHVKNLAAAIWSSDVLIHRSVTGKKGNFKGDGLRKPKLTPEKLNYLRDLFKERLFNENPNISEEEVNLRCKNIPTFISQKIATLKRVPNTALINT